MQSESNNDHQRTCQLPSQWGPPTGNHPNISLFTKNEGPVSEISDLMADDPPEKFYFALVDENFFHYVAEQTNLYATQVVTKKNDIQNQSRLHNWVPTDNFEIKRFFGLISYMGIVKMPYISSYWSKEKIFNNEMARNCMSRNRFELLLRMVHFADNSNDNGDRLHKIQPVVEKLVHNFQCMYEPTEVVCIDESLIPFRGRLVMRQYIKNKRHKYGVKFFKLCCSGGYTYNMKIYAGKNLEQQKCTPTSVVMKLCQPILNSGRTVVTDNWYTSIELANNLVKSDTHLVGTLRKNRKGLPSQIHRKIKKGELNCFENVDGISVFKWHDKRDVYFLSMKHTDNIVQVSNHQGKPSQKPEVVRDYNIGKSSVDISDQMTAYQSPLRKSIKWYRKMAIEIILNTAMVNAWILYKSVTKNSDMKILEFRKKVTYTLCESQFATDTATPSTSTGKRKRNIQKHQIAKRSYDKRKPCRECYEKVKKEQGWKIAKNLKKIRTYCLNCDQEPSLCLECFNKVHEI